MDQNVEDKDLLLGFLALYETLSKDGYLEAVLVTNAHGIPQEFRCTHPVKPTTIQKPLYGDALQPYIGVNMCGKPLIQSIGNTPSLIVIIDDFLLDVRTTSSCPVILVRRAGEVIDVEHSEESARTLKRERVDCSSGSFQPIILSPHPVFEDDMQFARGVFDKIFSHLDPLEPFERMAKAIEVLAQQDSRFQ